MRTASITALMIILLSFGIAFYLYPQMPDIMASHWNAAGKVDGYMPKFWGLFLMPLITLFMFLLFIFIPRIDPLKQNIHKFRNYFDKFIVIIIAFMLYIYMLTLAWSLGFSFNMTYALIPAFAILFYYAGILISKAKRNWFIGIRTPWTMSSDKVWDKTHKLGGTLFKAAALLSLLGLVFQDYAFLFMIMPVLAVAFYTMVYSYFEYKKQMKKRR